MQASRMEIKKGQVILKSQPFAHMLFNSCRGRYCDYCFTESENVKKCTACSFSYYCNRDCQKSDWKDHKNECLNLNKYRHDHSTKFTFLQLLSQDPNGHWIPPDLAVLVSRVVYKLKRNSTESEKVGNVTIRFEDLMSHSAEIKNDPEKMMKFTIIIKIIKDLLPPSDELFEIIGKIELNSSTICNEFHEIGTGLYLGPSIFHHSCKPNAASVYVGRTIQFTALEDISHFDASHVFIAYIGIMKTTEERRRFLKNNYFFDCTCANCLDVEKDLIANSILCLNRNCTSPTVIKENSFTCLKCGEVNFKPNKLHNVQKLTEKSKLALELIDDLIKKGRNEEAYEKIEECIQETKSTLHPLNVLYARILQRGFDVTSASGKWKPACKFAKQLLDACRHYYGDIHPTIGIHLLHTGHVHWKSFCQNLSDGSEAVKFLKEAVRVLSITHTKSHKLYSTCESLLSRCESQITTSSMQHRRKRVGCRGHQ